MPLAVSVKSISHNFKNKNIFSEFSADFSPGSKTAILGSNGSGKSTLIKIISGFLTPQSGVVEFLGDDKTGKIEPERFNVSVCTPFMALENRFTLNEHFDFHFSLKKLQPGLSKREFFKLCFLEKELDTPISELSSGMTQRLKLAFALLSKSELLLLDEPCSNLDKAGVVYFSELIQKFHSSSTVIVASNSVKDEISFCNKSITL